VVYRRIVSSAMLDLLYFFYFARAGLLLCAQKINPRSRPRYRDNSGGARETYVVLENNRNGTQTKNLGSSTGSFSCFGLNFGLIKIGLSLLLVYKTGGMDSFVLLVTRM
jgi:hypothetical protein